MLSTIALLLVAAGPGADLPAAPAWNKNELKQLLVRVEAAGRAPSAEARDLELARTFGAAYRVTARAAESLDEYSRRTLKKREPAHPPVKNGQWLLAVARRFYADVADRAGTLSRFETDRRDQQYLDTKAQEARAAADQIGGMLQTRVEAAGGFVAPLPIAPGEPSTKVGVEALVNDGKISLDNLDRATFPGDRPPAEIPRTAGGAVRELVAAQKNYNLRSDTIGMVDKNLKAGKGQLRAYIPAQAPALYLNELVRAAKEASMHVVYVMVHDPKDGSLKQLPLALEAPKKPRKKKKKAKAEPVRVRCNDADPMQTCVTRMVEHAAGAPLLFFVD